MASQSPPPSLRDRETPRIAILGLTSDERRSFETAAAARGWGILDASATPRDAHVVLATRDAWQARAASADASASPAVVLVLARSERGAESLPAADEYLERPFCAALATHRIATVLRARGSASERAHPAAAPADAEGTSAVNDGNVVDAAIAGELLAGRAALVRSLERGVDAAGERDLAALLVLQVGRESVVSGAQGRVHQLVARSLHTVRGEAAARGAKQHDAARLETGSYALHVSGELDERQVAVLAGRLHELVSHAFEEEWPDATPAVNVGYAVSPARERARSELVERGEVAVYCAGQNRKSRVQAFSEPMRRWARERALLVEGLKKAVSSNELVVYYQPRVDAQTRRVLGMEALVRWIHPELGLVPPARFIPLAEESGLIVPIGEWVLREACRQAKEWQDAGLQPIRMSVNLSAVQFRQPDLFETMTRAVDDMGLAREFLELELTESMLMNDPRTTIATLERFKSAGIHLSIDDFGTGYSSLSYLRRFPIDALKIDQSFVREVTTNPDDAAIATAIILMGHSLKLSVVAEGVETESQLSFLQILQCNEVQGYLISPPVPPAKAIGFLPPSRLASARG